ncbi:Mdm33 family-domain-containing protein [Xylaria sp. FL0933]|nr:Mdm33 family-domain-containing protein [Xylaria sp. FL0933]
MSTSRAFGPLYGVGSRLIVDQFMPRSATATGIPWKQLFCSAASPRNSIPRRATISICWSCRHDYASRRQHLRFSSSSTKPPNHDGKSEYKPQNSSSSSSSSASSAPSSHSTPADAYTQASSIDSSKLEKEHDRPSPQPSRPSPSPSPSPSTSNPDLPSAQNSRRSALNQSLSSFMDRAQTALFAASQRINDLTGYSSIETLKSQISTLESDLHAAQAHLTAARSAYKSAVSDRAATQREVTTLLARQKTWTPADFERFTTLYRQDYELEASVQQRAAELEEAEREAERLARELGAGILARYHEEQIWSDKIRRMSTWGTWGLMGVNILLFLLLQFGAEPWRRRRLVRGFEEKVREALAEERTAREQAQRFAADAAATAAATAPPSIADDEVETTGSKVEQEEIVMAAPDVPMPESEILPPSPSSRDTYSYKYFPQASWRETLTDPDYWRHWRDVLSDLVSDRKIALRMKDVSLIAIEGVATGAVVAGTLVIILLRRT